MRLGWAVRVGLVASALGAAVAGLAASCFVGGFEVLEATSTAGGSGGAAAASPGGGGSGACQHAVWPAKPQDVDGGGAELDLVFAIRSVDFGENADGPSPIGYDLDYRCTCQGEEGSCVEPDFATADHCDGPQGRDNAAAALFKRMSLFTNALDSSTNSAAANAGDWSILIRISDYNGQLDDDQITLAMYPSPGRDNLECYFGSDTAPAWDGSDEWPIAADAIAGLGGAGAGGGTAGGGGAGGTCPSGPPAPEIYANPRYVDAAGWVSNGVAVANLSQADLIVSSTTRVFTLKLTAGFITARIEAGAVEGTWTLREGVLAARWRLADFFAMLGALGIDEDPLCTDHPAYSIVKALLCQYPDVASTQTGPTTPCDSLSLGMGFEAESARLGPLWWAPSGLEGCPDETNPAYDSCDQ